MTPTTLRGFARFDSPLGLACAVVALAGAAACGGDGPTAPSANTPSTSTPGSGSGGTVSITSVVTSRFRNGVSVAPGATTIVVRSRGVPDHLTPYWGVGQPLYEPQLAGQTMTPNGSIAEQTYTMTIPATPGVATTKEATSLGPIGMALNGVAIYNDREAGNVPVDAGTLRSFDRAGAHTSPGGTYHYHFDNEFLAADDAGLFGFLRDGFPIYGRRDQDGSYPSDLDTNGGHVGATADFATPVYHYHSSRVSYLSSRYYILKAGAYHGNKGTFTF